MNSLRVLLADDDPVNLRVGAALLERAGHRVVTAAGGDAAVAAAAGGGFDVVLMDVRMPDRDGPAAAAAIRAAETGGRRVPILALTASPWPEEMAACRAAGMDGCMMKPLDMQRLAEALSDVGAGAGWRVEAAPAAVDDTLIDGGHLAELGQDLSEDLFAVSLRACLTSLDQSIEALRRAEDGATVASLAHKLRGTAGTYGLAALHRRAGEVEARAKAGPWPMAGEVAALLLLAENSREALRAYIAAPR